MRRSVGTAGKVAHDSAHLAVMREELQRRHLRDVERRLDVGGEHRAVLAIAALADQ
jgi:hypothetical protein